MKRQMRGIGVLLLLVLAVPFVPAFGAETDPQVISVDELKKRLEDPGVTVLDVRSGGDWGGSPEKIARAVREDPNKVDAWTKNYKPSQTLVLYCS